MSKDEHDIAVWRDLGQLVEGDDLDAVRVSGHYAVHSALNGPASATDYFLTVLDAPIDGVRRTIQKVHEPLTGRQWTRVRGQTGWGTWTRDNPSNQSEVLTAARNYYVRADGNDANNGLTNTASGAFRTVHAAIAATKALDLNRYPVLITLGTTGDYTNGNVPIVIDELKNPVVSVLTSYAIRIIGGANNTAATNYKLPTINVRPNDNSALVELWGIETPGVVAYNANVKGTFVVFTGTQPIAASSESYFETIGCRYVPAGASEFLVSLTASEAYISMVIENTPNFSNAVFLFNCDSQRDTRLTLGTVTGTATGIQYKKVGNAKNRVFIVSPTTPGVGTGGETFSALPGNSAQAGPINTITDTLSGVIKGSLVAGEYDLAFNVPNAYRIVNFGARTKSGSAICQLRLNGNGVVQGDAIGSTLTASTGSPTYAANVNNKVVGYGQCFTMTVSGTPTAVDLVWIIELERVSTR